MADDEEHPRNRIGADEHVVVGEGSADDDGVSGNVDRGDDQHVGDHIDGRQPGDPLPFTTRQEKALSALMTESSVSRAAAASGVPERTLYFWMKSPEFRGEYLKRRREAFGQSIGLTQRYASMAVQTLAKVMTDPSSAPACRIQAAATMLKFGRDALELDDLAQRVEALESVQQERAGRSRGVRCA